MKIDDEVIAWHADNMIRRPVRAILKSAWGIFWELEYLDAVDSADELKFRSPEHLFPFDQQLYDEMAEIAYNYDNLRMDAELLIKSNRWKQFGDPSQIRKYDEDQYDEDEFDTNQDIDLSAVK